MGVLIALAFGLIKARPLSLANTKLSPSIQTKPKQKVVDVGGGTGFCTLGVVERVDPANVTLIDQSPHQLAKARAKPGLKGVTILEGDAEALPFATDSFDRYVSAGSIEYWPDPQRGICEAYRCVPVFRLVGRRVFVL